MIDLLQIVDSTQKIAAHIQGDTNGDGKLSIFELLSTGGIIMIPLALLFLITIFVFFERYIASLTLYFRIPSLEITSRYRSGLYVFK